ncbi:MAG: antibiotic biosynthesis monooxygenase [Acidobacteriota bacterium]|nr:antibiotic biosynthesis monooxygenase [Acidobacteriota bacterium]
MRKSAGSVKVAETALFVSTFQAKKGFERMLQYELQRMVNSTRRERECLFCDLYRLSQDPTVFTIHSVWKSRDNWLSHSGWKNHPAACLLEQCLLEPVSVVAMDEVPEAA